MDYVETMLIKAFQGNRERILLVEDEEENSAFDLVLSDVVLPDKNALIQGKQQAKVEVETKTKKKN